MTDRDDTSENGDELTLWNARPTGRVLVVDADQDIARMLEVRLAREGHEVVVARSGREALEKVEQEDVDTALVDRTLTDVPALELMAKLNEGHAPFETILMTFDPTVELFVEALEGGAFDVVVKPFSNLKLVTAKVDKAIGKVHAERDRNELARMLHQQTKSGPPGTPANADEYSPPGPFDLDGMSGVDTLTGLPNRKAAEERFRIETARALRYDRPLCIAFASVDHLDAVVDRFGREVADGVLRGITQLFRGMVRDVDYVARRGGSEFFLLLPETTKDSGFVAIDRIRSRLISTSFADYLEPDAQGEVFKVTASFGVAGLPTDTLNADLLREAAQAALERARSTGGDQVMLYDPSFKRA